MESQNEKFSPKKILFLGAALLGFLLAAAFAGGFVSNAIYCWATGDWDFLASTLVTIGAGYILGAAAAAYTSGVAIGAALSGIAAALGPWGWLALGAIITVA
ncbi:MAG: hypothetical protein RBG13Loki_1641 [Promethearchaeota archaeon CR_4]|nr:MAG: hypothetical protein RBG13Loki_1641 [Candidatus Lokiarchaeota archaeon CR_4]